MVGRIKESPQHQGESYPYESGRRQRLQSIGIGVSGMAAGDHPAGPAAPVLYVRLSARSLARHQPVRAYGVEGPRGLYERHDRLNCPDAQRLPLAGHGIRLASLRWRSERPLAAPSGAASPLHLYSEAAGRARRDSIDRHLEWAGKLEGRQADTVPGTCWANYFCAP